LLFVREGTLMAQSFDNRSQKLKGPMQPIAERIGSGSSTGGWAFYSVSSNGVLTFRQQGTPQQLTWYDREGKVIGIAGELGAAGYLTLSPDGTRVAVTKGVAPDPIQIWLISLTPGGTGTRFVFGSASNTSPVWSPDGSRMIFSSNTSGPYNLYQKPVSGAINEEIVLSSPDDKHATSWSRDGRFLLYTVVHAQTGKDIWVLPLNGGRKPVPLLVTRFAERQACFSPDRRWVAYTSDESGQNEVYVQSFSMNSNTTAVETGGKWPVSNGAAEDPHWSGNGRELYYRSASGALMVVEITPDDKVFRAGTPKPLRGLTFSHSTVNFAFGSQWDASADGRRFLSGGAVRAPLPTVVLNWQTLLRN
jgi:Tol biopolymer transport system component